MTAATELYDDDIAIFMDMTDDEIKEMILLLMIQEKVQQRLAKYRPQQLAAKPV